MLSLGHPTPAQAQQQRPRATVALGCCQEGGVETRQTSDPAPAPRLSPALLRAPPEDWQKLPALPDACPGSTGPELNPPSVSAAPTEERPRCCGRGLCPVPARPPALQLSPERLDEEGALSPATLCPHRPGGQISRDRRHWVMEASTAGSTGSQQNASLIPAPRRDVWGGQHLWHHTLIPRCRVQPLPCAHAEGKGGLADPRDGSRAKEGSQDTHNPPTWIILHGWASTCL